MIHSESCFLTIRRKSCEVAQPQQLPQVQVKKIVCRTEGTDKRAGLVFLFLGCYMKVFCQSDGHGHGHGIFVLATYPDCVTVLSTTGSGNNLCQYHMLQNVGRDGALCFQVKEN
jgi:hypothetical protein